MSKTLPLPETRDGRLIQHVGVGENVDHQNDASAVEVLGWATGVLGQSCTKEIDRASPFQPAVARDVDMGGLHGYVSMEDFVVPVVVPREVVPGFQARASKARASKRPRPLPYALSAFDDELARLGDDTFFGDVLRLGQDADPPNGAFDDQPSPRKPPLRAAEPLRAAKIDDHLAWANRVLWEPSRRQECVAAQVAREIFKTGFSN
mmetsp:Transcript_17747/g.42897  ORF Transcript_17747/g.42897 Transcript_17747/m.42897 type:complete len:206 (-) Transcript_17747:133-750(-)